MEVSEQLYEGGTPYKTPIRADANSVSRGRKHKQGGFALPTKPKKGHAGKRKKNHSGNPSDDPTSTKKTLLVHGPGQSTDDWKVLKNYPERHAAQITFKEK